MIKRITCLLLLFFSTYVFAQSPLLYRKALLKLNQCPIQVEIADSTELRRLGLSGRKSMAPDAGMLFIYTEAGHHPIWMKDMNFPLDLIWIKEGKVVDIIADVPPPPPSTPNDKLSLYYPATPATYILEVNAGVAARCALKIGDKVSAP